MPRPLIDLPHPPDVVSISDEALGLAPYVGSLFSRTLRFVGDSPPYAPSVAIVGTRKADPEALAFTRELATSLAAHGVIVVSGGALGIDAAAHEGALEAGRTVAVLASGLARAYPPVHAGLFGRIARSGALVTTYDDDASPVAFRLLERNALIAALVSAVVVVQAPARSGALSTAASARALGRKVLAVPASPWDPKGAGNLELFGLGARPCTCASDVADALGLVLPRKTPATARSLPADVTPDARQLHALLGTRPRHVDDLAAATGFDAPRVQRAVLSLLLMGLAEERPGGRYVRA
jgi:DNA processing protein